MLRDSKSYEVQIIDAVRSVNKALGGTYGTSSAIYKNEFNQYEVQLIDAIKGIGRTLSGKGLSISGFGAGEVSAEQFQELSRRVTKLESESFFRLVDGNVTLKTQYQNLWVPGWLAAGGIGSGSSATRLSQLQDVYHDANGILRADGTTPVQPGDVLVFNSTLGWVAAVGGGGGGGTVTDVTLNGVSVLEGTVAILPTSLPASDVSAWAKAPSKPNYTFSELTSHPTTLSGYGISDVFINDGIITIGNNVIAPLTSFTETDPTVPSWAKQSSLQYSSLPPLYVGKTRVKDNYTSNDTLVGIDGFTTAATATASNDSSKVKYESGAWHFYGNIYADGWMAAGGVGSFTLVVAWDGESTPVPADIPAGVTATYGGTTYTGQLQPGASTTGKIYLVADGQGEYDRYITTQSGSTYSWTRIGSTAVDLDNYIRADEGVLLGAVVRYNVTVRV